MADRPLFSRPPEFVPGGGRPLSAGLPVDPSAPIRAAKDARLIDHTQQAKWARMHPDALEPKRAYPGDAGFDLTAIESVLISPFQFATIRTGVAIQWPPGVWGLLVGRSSTFNRGLLVNQAIIDNGYRGELWAVVRNISDEEVAVSRGERLVQYIPIPMVSALRMNQVDYLDPSERGERGFGSSGR